MNIEKAKAAMEGMPINYSSGVGSRVELEMIKVSLTSDFKAVVDDLAFEEGRSFAATLRLALKNYVQEAIYNAEQKAGRYNWKPDPLPPIPEQR